MVGGNHSNTQVNDRGIYDVNVPPITWTISRVLIKRLEVENTILMVNLFLKSVVKLRLIQESLIIEHSEVLGKFTVSE